MIAAGFRLFSWTRLFSVLLFFAAAWWSSLALRSDLAVNRFTLAVAAIGDQANAVELVSRELGALRQSLPSILECPPEAHQWAASFSLDAAQQPDISAAERSAILAEARTEISQAIACKRSDGDLWLLAARLEMLAGNPDGVIAALQTSYDLTPNDGFVLVRRLSLIAEMGRQLDERLQPIVRHDLEMLANVRPVVKNGLLYEIHVATASEAEDWFAANLSLRPVAQVDVAPDGPPGETAKPESIEAPP